MPNFSSYCLKLKKNMFKDLKNFHEVVYSYNASKYWTMKIMN